MNIPVTEVRKGQWIATLGVVRNIRINYRDEAIRDEKAQHGIRVDEDRIGGKLRARLASESAELCYRKVPNSLTITGSQATRTYLLDATVQTRNPASALRKAA